MILDIMKLAGGTASGLLLDGEGRKALSRSLVVELRCNLNLLQLLPQTGGVRTPSQDRNDWEWRAQVLSIETLLAYLTLGDHPLKALAGRVLKRPSSDDEGSFEELLDALSFILIKVREIRAIAAAPDEAELPKVNWPVRHKNLVSAHLRALELLKESDGP